MTIAYWLAPAARMAVSRSTPTNMNAATVTSATPATAVPTTRTTPTGRRRKAARPPWWSSRWRFSATGASRAAGFRRSILEITRSAKPRDGDMYGSRCSSAAMGVKSSGKSCSIMDSSRVTYGSGTGSVSAISGEFSGSKKGLFQVLQVLPQLLAGAVDIGLYRTEGQLHDFGDLVVGVVLDVPQNYAGAVLGSELRDGLLDGRADLLRFELFEWRFSSARNRDRGRAQPFSGKSIRRALDADRIELAPAKVIDGDVVGDLEQPAGEFELGAITVDVVEDLDEGLLREIFGGLVIAHHPIDERIDRPLVPLDQLTIRVLTPFLGEDDYLLVGYVGVGLGWHRRSVSDRQVLSYSCELGIEDFAASGLTTIDDRRLIAD